VRSGPRSRARPPAASTWAAPRCARRTCAIRLDSTEELEALDLQAIGPEIEHAPLFPNRTNASFWAEVGPSAIRARIFERGAGETLSSGTGACGAAVAHVLRGGVPPVTVRLDGGDLEVDVDSELRVDLTGWAVPVYRGELSAELLADLGYGDGDD
jgi:diaminopimelate epimerase